MTTTKFAPLSQEDVSDLTREPVFIDLETRSACDLRVAGGWNYANDPTTHLLTVSWSPAAGEYHIWYPWHNNIRADYVAAQKTKVTVHHGIELPEALADQLHRPWCAHNAWNFDSLVWSKLFGEMHHPANWIDTEPLARAVGLPGGLDAIGKQLWGEGKYTIAKAALKKHMHGLRYGDAADVPAGIMPMLAEYNVQDVVLLRGVWEEIVAWLKLPHGEWEVLNTHREINDRGAPIDRELLISLIDLTEEGKNEAVKQIAELTKDHKTPLKTINDLQSRAVMLKWLDGIGVTAFATAGGRDSDGKLKPSLRKELIAQFIDYHQSANEGDADDAGESEDESDDLDGVNSEEARRAARQQSEYVAAAVRVLQLRSAALRITGGKLAAAAAAVCDDGRVRGLFVYAGAHTFRWAGRRVQVQNLPRPKDGLTVEEYEPKKYRYPLWEIIDTHERIQRRKRDRATNRESGELDNLPAAIKYADVDRLLPSRAVKRFRNLTPDDAASALVRSLFTAGQDVSEYNWQNEDDPLGLLAADLSGIEARVLGWFAGEKGLMDTLWEGADLYIPMAEVMFGKWQSWPGVNPNDYKTAKKHPYRQAGKIVRLGAGYQLGGPKMDVYAAVNGIDLAGQGTSGPEAVKAYRRFHPAIAGVATEKSWYDTKKKENVVREVFEGGFWSDLSNAAKTAARHGGPVTVGVGAPITFEKEGAHVVCYLPSGRRLVYRHARVNDRGIPPFLKGQLDCNGQQRVTEVFEYTSPRYGIVHMYGGKWAENVVQAASRDFLASAMVRLERADLPVVLHVHDEAVSVGRFSQKGRFMAEFTALPEWAKNFPLDAEGGWMPRYSKSAPPGTKYSEEIWRNGAYLKPA